MLVSFSWNRLLNQWLKDFKLVTFIVGLLFAVRFAILGIFHEQIGEELDITQKLLFIKQSLLFDIRVALMIVTPTVLLSFIFNWALGLKNWINRLRMLIGSAAVIVTILLGAGDIGFFHEYHDQYNHWIYGLYYDDFGAIVDSIWKTYPMIVITITEIVLIISAIWGLYKILKNGEINFHIVDKIPGTNILKLSVTLVLLVLFGIGLRGSVASRPLQQEDIGVTKDEFLNKLVPNFYFALYYTHSEHKHLNKASGLEKFLPDRSVAKALRTLFPLVKHKSSNIDDWVERKVTKWRPTVEPNHVFIIVLESQDSWPMLEKYANLELVPNLKRFANEGISVRAFVSAGNSTRTTLCSIISGLPDAYVYTHFQPSSQKAYPTAIANQFKQLGYQTNLFYGGHLSWQRLGEFAKNQGFDNMFGREHMAVNTPGDSWGVYDEHLFDFILKKIDPRKPSFNLIMTTTNHSPYPIDLSSKGCPLVANPKKYPQLEKSASDPKILGHFWYNDWCIGKFIDEAEKRLPGSLFAITGDHSSRRYFTHTPSLYEKNSVPFIIYGKNMLINVKAPKAMAGSHIDMAPTLIELIAPKNFTYKSFGSNLLNENERQVGMGADVVITPNGIQWVDDKTIVQPLPWTETADIHNDYYYNLYNALHGIGWARIMQGTEV